MNCPADCHNKKKSCCGIGFMSIPAQLGDDKGKLKPKNGDYHNMLVRYEANGAIYMYVNDGVFVKIKEGDL